MNLQLQRALSYFAPARSPAGRLQYVIALCCHAAAVLHLQDVRVDEILGAERAREVIEEAIQMYVENYVPRKYRVNK